MKRRKWLAEEKMNIVLEGLKGEQCQLLKRIVRKGGVLYIHSLDRFGRNKKESL
jgi:hypothetical protein